MTPATSPSPTSSGGHTTWRRNCTRQRAAAGTTARTSHDPRTARIPQHMNSVNRAPITRREIFPNEAYAIRLIGARADLHTEGLALAVRVAPV